MGSESCTVLRLKLMRKLVKCLMLLTSNPWNIWCFKIVKSFLCLLFLILQYYFIQKLEFVPVLFLMFMLHVGSFVHSFFATSLTVICYSLLWMSFTVLMSMVDVIINDSS